MRGGACWIFQGGGQEGVWREGEVNVQDERVKRRRMEKKTEKKLRKRVTESEDERRET